MWRIVNKFGGVLVTSDAKTVKDAIDLGWQVWRNGRRVW